VVELENNGRQKLNRGGAVHSLPQQVGI
jgi:hypothetical protein